MPHLGFYRYSTPGGPPFIWSSLSPFNNIPLHCSRIASWPMSQPFPPSRFWPRHSGSLLSKLWGFCCCCFCCIGPRIPAHLPIPFHSWWCNRIPLLLRLLLLLLSLRLLRFASRSLHASMLVVLTLIISMPPFVPFLRLTVCAVFLFCIFILFFIVNMGFLFLLTTSVMHLSEWVIEWEKCVFFFSFFLLTTPFFLQSYHGNVPTRICCCWLLFVVCFEEHNTSPTSFCELGLVHSFFWGFEMPMGELQIIFFSLTHSLSMFASLLHCWSLHLLCLFLCIYNGGPLLVE